MNKHKAIFNNNLLRNDRPNIFSSKINPPDEQKRIANRLKRIQEGKRIRNH